MTTIQVNLINMDGDTQAREDLNQETIESYADAMREGEVFPPVVLFDDGHTHWIGDGFHRVAAAMEAGLEKIAADIRQGGRVQALRFALGANARHGLRRSHADIKRAVLLAYENREELALGDVPSANAVAKICGISQPCAKNHLQTISTWSKAPTRTGADGKSYPVPPPPPPSRVPPPPPPSSEARNQPPPPPPNVGTPSPAPPAPPKIMTPVDREGLPIPEGFALKTWNEVRPVIQEHLSSISRVRSDIKRLQEQDPGKLAGANPSSVLIDLNNAYRKLSMAMPYSVCPYCAGDGCKACEGRGMLDKVKWDAAPADMKAQSRKLLEGMGAA